jgi:hypothetical protein
MSEQPQICDHSCAWHEPVDDPHRVWVEIWRNREVDAMTQIRSQLDDMDDGEVRRTLAWLNDYFTETIENPGRGNQ